MKLEFFRRAHSCQQQNNFSNEMAYEKVVKLRQSSHRDFNQAAALENCDPGF